MTLVNFPDIINVTQPYFVLLQQRWRARKLSYRAADHSSIWGNPRLAKSWLRPRLQQDNRCSLCERKHERGPGLHCPSNSSLAALNHKTARKSRHLNHHYYAQLRIYIKISVSSQPRHKPTKAHEIKH